MSKNTLNKFKAIQKPESNTVGETRHYPAASKEWSNSIYAYNKNTVKSLPVKDRMAESLITSYFNYTPISKNTTKSRRMRDLIRRNSTKKLFVSRPEIKQTSNKVIITAYTADREKDFFLRKLYFLNESFNTAGTMFPARYISALNNVFNGKGAGADNKLVESAANENRTYVKSILPKGSTKRFGRLSRLHIWNADTTGLPISVTGKTSIASNSGSSHQKLAKRLKTYTVKKNLFRNRLAISIIKKKNFLKNLFFYSFLKWTLSIFQINVSIYQFKNESLEKLIMINKGDWFKVLNLSDSVRNHSNNSPHSFSVMLKKVNVILLQLLIVNLKKALVNTTAALSVEKLVGFLFKYFKLNYYNDFVQKYLKKEILALNYLYMLSINNFKFDRFLPGLKHLISKLYNKKVELNIVNLRYLHLNSDIFSESVAIKLKNKQNSLLRVLRGSLKLVKIPHKLLAKDHLREKRPFSNALNSLRPLNNYKALPESTLEGVRSARDVLHVVLEKMFLQQTNNVKTTKKIDVLNSIKYKWITGVRLEAKGRLTKRFTASRSVFKFKYKGNLRNVDYSGWNVSKKTPSTVMLRGQLKPNLQYTFVNSKKRIGAFGIKGWISSS